MITLVLGGARSGKSGVAERLVARHPAPVTYVATMVVGDSQELGLRVAAHRARRPPEWSTVESGTGLASLLGTLTGAALVDSLGPWLAAHPDFAVDSEALCASLVARQGDTVVVSDEVGLSVHPSAESGRQFRDAMGSLNQAVASVADQVVLVVAGRVLPLKHVEDH
jgi:adenosyl cobinamide kinase/adenosyl cobinamide phosphate guanylyltransferase